NDFKSFDILNLSNARFEINQFDTEDDEIYWISRKIKELLLTKKYQPKDFLIIRKNLKNSAKFYRQIFEAEKIPFKLEGMGGIFDNDLVLTLLSYLKILYAFSNPNDIFIKLQFNFDIFFENLTKIFYLDIKVENQNFYFEIMEMKKTLKSTKKTDIFDIKKMIFENEILVKNEILKESIKKFLEIFEFYQKNKNLNIKNLLIFICKKYGLIDINFENKFDQNKDKNKKFSVLSVFFKTLSDFEKIFLKIYKSYTKTLNLEEFIKILDEMLKSYTFETSINDNKENIIEILTIANSKMLEKEKKIVFFAGCSENIIPQKFDINKKIIFGMKNFNDFEKFGIFVNTPKNYDEFLKNEKILFKIAISLSKEKCFISHANNCFSDSNLKFSSFISENIIENKKIINYFQKYESDKDYSKVQTKNEKFVFDFFMNNTKKVDFDIKLDKSKKDALFSSLKTILKNKKYSKSNVDNYIKCNRKFVFANLLFLKTEKEMIYLRFGNIIHGILLKFHKIYNNSTDFATKAAKIFLLKLIDETFEIEKNLKNFDCLGEVEWYKNFAKTLLLEYLEDSLNFGERRIIALEKSFEAKIGELKIKGRIDRIDKLSDKCLEILDYKTSTHKNIGTKTLLKAIENNEDLQFLFYYLLLSKNDGILINDTLKLSKDMINNLKFSYIWLEKNTGKQKAEKTNTSYKKYGFDMLDEEAIKILGNGEKILLKLLKEIVSDDFEKIKLKQNNICKECEFSFICKK
ncbi:MAG: PD-(D/E)XK nuclease family protein, partial [Elusimicrobiota bacterium]|nr:PD-(D/E)XK nuclease family protein [Elusimicrobiota bacterium]